jgi:hypothetical protein
LLLLIVDRRGYFIKSFTTHGHLGFEIGVKLTISLEVWPFVDVIELVYPLLPNA